jgi:lipoprotein-anchoring transpeptidase ErfK/SrfK
VISKGVAMRYGIAIGKEGFGWTGEEVVTAKTEWPTWTPPEEMRVREAKKGHILPAKMEGGLDNPLGARAMYLGSSQYRIHGTNKPDSIGKAASSGCFRMANEDVEHLYAHVKIGTRVVIRD